MAKDMGARPARTCTTVIGHLSPDLTQPIRCGLPAAYTVETVNVDTGWSVLEFTCKGCAGSALGRRESAEQREAYRSE